MLADRRQLKATSSLTVLPPDGEPLHRWVLKIGRVTAPSNNLLHSNYASPPAQPVPSSSNSAFAGRGSSLIPNLDRRDSGLDSQIGWFLNHECERGRFVMPVPLRGDFDASRLSSTLYV